MRQELQRADRHAVGPVAEEGALARLRPVAERRRDASAERCGVALSTAFRWRHRFLTSPAVSPILTGIVEADETFVLRSYKGSRAWERAEQGLPGAEAPDREARGRGGNGTEGGLSHEQVPSRGAPDGRGGVVSPALPVDSADAIRAVLEPVLSKDALLVT